MMDVRREGTNVTKQTLCKRNSMATTVPNQDKIIQ